MPTPAPFLLALGLFLASAFPALAGTLQLLSYEAIPAAQIALPKLDGAIYDDRNTFTRRVEAELVPAILKAAGMEPAAARTQVTPGGWRLVTNPSLQTLATLDDGPAERLAAALGWVFRQESVLITETHAPDGHTGFVLVRFPAGTLSAALAHTFFLHAAGVNPALGEGYTAFDDDLLFLNLRGAGGKPVGGLDDGAFTAALGRAADSFPPIRVSIAASGAADSRLISNNWTTSPNGEGFARHLDAALLALLAPLRDRHTVLVGEAADRYGWR